MTTKELVRKRAWLRRRVKELKRMAKTYRAADCWAEVTTICEELKQRELELSHVENETFDAISAVRS